MKVDGLRSPDDKVAGLYHLGRMPDKIRLHQAGRLPQEYHAHLGLNAGINGASGAHADLTLRCGNEEYRTRVVLRDVLSSSYHVHPFRLPR